MDVAAEVATAVDWLGLGDQFSFDDIVGALQHRRARPLRVVELAGLNEADGLCAVWVMTEAEDLVLYAHSESQLHRQQFVLHELAHMILGHDRDAAPEDGDVLLPNIPASTRRRLLRRQDLLTEDEIVAEALADRLAAAIRGSVCRESRFVEIFG